MSEVDRVVKTIKSDDRYKRLSKMFATESYFRIPFSEWQAEIDSIQRLRPTRYLRPTESGFIMKLAEASTQEQSSRSRLVEMRVHCIKVEFKLNRALSLLEDHLLLRYSSELARAKSTQAERARIIKIALSKFRDFLTNTETIKQMTEEVIGDIDKAHWSMRLDVQAFDMHNRPESTL